MSTPDASAEKSPLVVGVVVFDSVMQLDFIGVTSYLELLPTVGQPVKFLTISHVAGPLRSAKDPAMGMPLYASHGFRDVTEHLDILLIPGGGGRVNVQKDAAFLEFIGAAAAKATYVLSVCTGSAILAATGFLDGRRATTNKIAYHDVVTQRTQVQWVYKARWVEDGNVWTSSGVTAGMDMAHAFVASIYGKDVAANMAHILEVEPNTDASNDPFASM